MDGKDALSFKRGKYKIFMFKEVTFTVNLPKFRSNNKFFWRPTRSTPTQESDLATFFLRPTKSNKNFFLMRPMKRNQNQNQDSNPENYHHRYLRTNVQNPFWMRPTRSTVI